MRRSDIGPLGVVTLVLTLLLQVAARLQAVLQAAGAKVRWRKLELPPPRQAVKSSQFSAIVAAVRKLRCVDAEVR